MDINKLAKEIFEQNKAAGWWDDMNRCIYQTLQLVNTEIAEATEGVRKDLMDDHLPHRKMEEVELADAMIRMLDLGGRCGWVHEDEWVMTDEDLREFVSILRLEKPSRGLLHLGLSMVVTDIAKVLQEYDSPYELVSTDINYEYSQFINSVLCVCHYHGYDLFETIEEKISYNKSRLDHKRENRVKEGGKKI